MKPAERPIRTLIVDDSTVIRTILRTALSRNPRIHIVGEAVDGVDALRKLSALRPDVVTLDVEMPRLNGIGVLERAAGKLPVSFVMVSTLTEAGARITLEALRKGAFDYVTKPQTSGRPLAEFQSDVQAKVIAAAAAKGRVRRLLSADRESSAPQLPPNTVRGWVVGIGISCGGPPTLSQMLPAFPSDFVPIVITQHMPAQFTGPFARQLDGLCAMKVTEAQHGDTLEQGHIYVAPGSHHLKLRRVGTQLSITLDAGAKVSGHRPSVDAMFDSLAQTAGARCVGVIMTGMGTDGAAAVRRLHAAGAWTIAQDADTSLVYGMPKAAAETGAINQVLPVGRIPAAIAKALNARQATPNAHQPRAALARASE